MQKTCTGCKQTFETNQPQKETCSTACRKRVTYRRRFGLPIEGKLEHRRKVTREPRVCEQCHITFAAYRRGSRFCSDLCNAKWHYEQYNTVQRQRICKECQKPFTYQHRGRTWYCSDECARIAAVNAKVENKRFAAQWRKEHPEAADKYHKKRTETHPDEVRSGITYRFFKKYPHISKTCQACGETRIVELAHKTPRNGAWRTLKNTTDKDVWILCPTCHRCLDFGIQTKEELGLPD